MRTRTQELSRLEYAAVFFLFALVAALFGFTGIAAGAALVAKILFVFFSVVALGSVLVTVLRDSTTS